MLRSGRPLPIDFYRSCVLIGDVPRRALAIDGSCRPAQCEDGQVRALFLKKSFALDADAARTRRLSAIAGQSGLRCGLDELRLRPEAAELPR
jgi:hypothetical protein